MIRPVICWDMNGTILNEELTTKTAPLKRIGSVRYKTSEISYEDEDTSTVINSFWEITPRKDIAAALEGLRRLGCINIVTTNAGDPSEIEKVLLSVGLKDHFSGVYCVSTGRFGKDYTFPLNQQGLYFKDYSKAIAVGNDYNRDCPINPLGMPLVLDRRSFYEFSSVHIAMAIAELLGAGKGDFSKGIEELSNCRWFNRLNINLGQNVDSRSSRFGDLTTCVIEL